MKTNPIKLILLSTLLTRFVSAQISNSFYSEKTVFDNAPNKISTYEKETADKEFISVGYFQGALLGEYKLTSNGSTDAYVAKFSNDGTLLWAFKIGGADEDKGYALIIDETKETISIEGIFKNVVDFDPSSSIYELSTKGSSSENFIATYNFNGAFLSAKSTGIHNANETSGLPLKVAPNPNTGEFSIDTEQETNIIVFNALGQIVFYQKLNAGTNVIDIKEQASGIYFVKTLSGEFYKIVKNN